MKVGGEVDISTADSLARRLRSFVDEGYRQVSLDLEDVRYLDSMGISAILSVHEALRAVHGQIRIVRSSPRVNRLFDVLRLEFLK